MTSARARGAAASAAASATGTPRAFAVRCAEFIVDASEALDSVIASRQDGREGDIEANVVRARECMRALAALVALMLRREDEGEAGEDDARRASVETRRLARKCEALERAVAKLKKDNVELEREVIEGRSAWFDEASRELDAALRRGAKSTSTSKSARETELERRCAMLQTQNNELRAEAIALEEDVVHAERVASKLQKENAVLLQATRAAKEEFKRLERRSKDSHRHGSDHSTVATLQRKVESMAGTIGELSRMNAHLARDSSTSSRPSARPMDKTWVSEEAKQASATAAAAATVFSCMANLQDTEEDKRQSAPSSPMRRMSEIERAMETVQLKSPNMSTSSPRLPAYLGSPFGNSVASIARSPLR